MRIPDAASRIGDATVKDALRSETDMALEYMRSGGRYTDPEYERFGALHVAATRAAASRSR